MKDLVISDIHLQPDRQGGTTVESRAQLERGLFIKLQELIEGIKPDRVIVVGDLFAKWTVSSATFRELWWTVTSYGIDWVILRGNHDSKSDHDNNISSLELLDAVTDDRIKVVFSSPEKIGDYYFIPHSVTQENFEACLRSIPEDVKFVFLHANWDNSFAAESEHSLNLTREQAKEITDRGITIIMGHEHSHNTHLDSRVIVMGCTWPTSISDCEGGDKYCLVIEEENRIAKHLTWTKEKFSEIHIDDIGTMSEVQAPEFIKVTGECVPAEAAEIVRKVRKLRSDVGKTTYVVKNGVSVIRPEKESTALTADNISAFDLFDIFFGYVPENLKKELESCRG